MSVVAGALIDVLLRRVLQTAVQQPGPGANAVQTAQQIDPAMLDALISAAAQRPAEPLPAPKLPVWIGALAILFCTGFFAVLGARIWLEYFGSTAADTTILDVAFGVLTSGLMLILSFAFGSSFGSRQKDARHPAEPASPSIFLPPPVAPADPKPQPAQPVEPGTWTSTTTTETPVAVDGIGRSTDPSTATKRIDVPVTSDPASIRYNNPGAQYPSERAAAFGQLGYGIIGGGHRIALFPHSVNGAAANFDLLYRNYTGMTIGAAGDKWTGGNGFGVPGYDPNAILAKESLDKPDVAIALMKAVARREAGKESPLTDEQWAQAYAMFKSGSADAWLADFTTGGDHLPATRPAFPGKPADLAGKIVAAMRRNGYVLDMKPGEVNIVYVEGLNEDGTINDDAPDKWNDLRVVIGFDGDKPVALGRWEATTEPGRYYTDAPVNPAGAARIEFGQYTAWKVGMHRGDHEGLIQTGGPVTVCRDANRDMIRTGDARDTGFFGINQHWGYDVSESSVGKASAGCLVGRMRAGHLAFMSIVKSDPRYIRDPEFIFTTTVIAERDVVG